MQWIIFAVIMLHGFIHLMGFIKGSGIKDVKELSRPVSKTVGLCWFTATILFIWFAILFITHSDYAWLIGLIAIVVSQLLIVTSWKDARFGTLPNVFLLVVCVFLFSSERFHQHVHHEAETIIQSGVLKTEKYITREDCEKLPLAVQNWLHGSGALGRPHIRVGQVFQQAQMQLKPGQDNWMPASAVQFTTIDKPSFIWIAEVKMNRIVRLNGRDKFEDGKGEMLIKLFSLVNVVNEQGAKLDEATMQRYLGEMVWFPSMALSEYISWESSNDTVATATMEYKGTRASGTFYFNAHGDVTKFSAMRYMGNDPDAGKYEWVMAIEDYAHFEGVKVPVNMTATWKLEDQDWTWLKLDVTDLRFNENVKF